jgi:hypothetical protein
VAALALAAWVGGARAEAGSGADAPADFESRGANTGPLAALQVEVDAELRGRVLVGDGPVPGVQVVLHRVAEDSAGELDSLRAGGDGSFRFALPSLPIEGPGGSIYFASVRHQGILYFGPPVTRPIQLDSLYTIRAYDTVPAPAGGAALPIGVRYLVFEPADSGWQVTDLFEITVDSAGTLVPRADDVTWSHALPADAREIELGAVSPGTPRVSGGRLEVTAPLSPGLRQFVVRYLVGSLEELRIPFVSGVEEVELLVREPVPPLEVAGLVAVEAVEMEPGVAYRRYAGPVAAGTEVVLDMGEEPGRLPLEWLTVLLALALAGAGLWAVGRGGGRGASVAAAGGPDGGPAGRPPRAGVPPAPISSGSGPLTRDERDRLLLEVAHLDERLDSGEVPESERERLHARRAALVGRLRDRR